MTIPAYQLKNINISPGVVLSPMSGVTSSPFRRLIKRLNPSSIGLMVSEFISVEAMTRKVPRSLAMMKFREEERPYGIQIFGHDIQRMCDAAKMVQDAGADLVDINCGCPAPKVVRKGGGCELMRQPEHLQKIFHEVRKVVSIPLTMKMRSGWDSNSVNALEIAKIAEGEGIEAIAIHARTRAQLYRGEADWEVVNKVAESVSIPVLGSGDVVCLDSSRQRLQGKIRGLFIGRGALYNPYVFTEIDTGVKRDLKNEPLTVISIIEEFMQLLLEDFPEKACIGKVKQLVSQMCAGYAWKKDLCRALTLTAQQNILTALKSSYD